MSTIHDNQLNEDHAARRLRHRRNARRWCGRPPKEIGRFQRRAVAEVLVETRGRISVLALVKHFAGVPRRVLRRIRDRYRKSHPLHPHALTWT